MQVWNALHAALCKYRTQKIAIAQLYRAISSQLRHVSTIGKKLVKQQYLLYTYPDNMVNLRPTNGWDRFGSLGHPYKFQLVLCLGSVTARHLVVGVSQTLRTSVAPSVQRRKVWLTLTTWLPCSNAAKTQKPLKLAGVPQANGSISAASRPKFTILWGHLEAILLLNKFFVCLSIHALVAKI